MGNGINSGTVGRKLADSRYSKFILYVSFVVSIFFIILNGVISRRFGMTSFSIGKMSIPTSGISGCVQAISVAACFVMVMSDYKRGAILSMFSLLFSVFGIMQGILKSGSMASLPGLVNCLLYAVLIIVMYKQLKASDYTAATDAATGLPNRYGFERELENRLHSQERGYVVYLHVGGFQDLNVNLGRKYGNQILREVSERIGSVMGNKGEVFKIEGAEFAMILPEGVDYSGMILDMVERIEKPIEVTKNGVAVNCYVKADAGVMDLYDRELSADEIMLYTDIAMNYAVNSSETKLCTYNEDLKKQVARETEIEQLIKEGLREDYFYLQYQPQYIMDGKKLRGFEALVRMKLPDGSIVSPGEFIPVAENSDLIVDIDRYVRRRAMNEFKEVCHDAPDGFAISVNVSAKEISNPTFAEEIITDIHEIGFPAQCLEIEITEYSFAQSVETTISNIKELREHNIKIAVDDFGTGYTSLAQLLNLPVTLLKIDKSLIDNIESSEMNRDFVKTVIYMGHLMACEVISEGVEEESQLRLLNQFDCDFIQGYVWSRPLEYAVALGMCRSKERVRVS
ncbi:MAG: EAL domain-containing protein [Lachnospiraceae bacterium]|nr:EAL domain-containing protein [Lachnospiraceae bacterium]